MTMFRLLPPVTPPPQEKARYPADPFTAYRFLVELDPRDDINVAGFSDVTGLAVETEVETFRVGGINHAEQQLAGATKFSSRLVLKRGMAHQDGLWRWYREVIAGKIVRRNVRITVLPYEGDRGMQWKFQQACPVKWTGPELHAATSAVAFESIELIHQGLLP